MINENSESLFVGIAVIPLGGERGNLGLWIVQNAIFEPNSISETNCIVFK